MHLAINFKFSYLHKLTLPNFVLTIKLTGNQIITYTLL